MSWLFFPSCICLLDVLCTLEVVCTIFMLPPEGPQLVNKEIEIEIMANLFLNEDYTHAW